MGTVTTNPGPPSAADFAALQRVVSRIRETLVPPVGAVLAYAGQIGAGFQPNDTWLPCDGRKMSSKTHNELFARIESAYGDGRNPDGSKDPQYDFNLPDYRGAFLRGFDPDKHLDVSADERLPALRVGSSGLGAKGNAIGSFQQDSLQSHGHTETSPVHTHDGVNKADGEHTHPVALPANAAFVGKHPSVRLGDGGAGDRWDGVTGTAVAEATKSGHSHKFEIKQAAPVAVGPPNDPARHSSETRPVNYSVNWIIRVL